MKSDITAMHKKTPHFVIVIVIFKQGIHSVIDRDFILQLKCTVSPTEALTLLGPLITSG